MSISTRDNFCQAILFGKILPQFSFERDHRIWAHFVAAHTFYADFFVETDSIIVFAQCFYGAAFYAYHAHFAVFFEQWIV